jgi:hypothetical protein
MKKIVKLLKEIRVIYSPIKQKDFKISKDERSKLLEAHGLATNKKHADRIKAILHATDGWT